MRQNWSIQKHCARKLRTEGLSTRISLQCLESAHIHCS
nr:MAG TPA: hypothetical protein [Caudoviricetes sp.]